MPESAFTPHEPSPAVTLWKSPFTRISSKLRQVVRLMVRTGYQDETGFHGGVKPAENNIPWPPVW